MKVFKLAFLSVLLIGFLSNIVFASVSNGTIDTTYNRAVVVQDDTQINTGYYTQPGISTYNVSIDDTALHGYWWSENFGWINLNCANNNSCGSANFKVANTGSGVLSGYAWGQNAGWINFGPFSNSATTPVSINTNGEFSGYAWTQNFGWLKFSCNTGDSDYPAGCTKTDWRPISARAACSNGLDDDSDGFTDYPADAGCTNSSDTDESGPFSNPHPPTPTPPAPPAPPTPPTPTPPTPPVVPTPPAPPAPPTPTPPGTVPSVPTAPTTGPSSAVSGPSGFSSPGLFFTGGMPTLLESAKQQVNDSIANTVTIYKDSKQKIKNVVDTKQGDAVVKTVGAVGVVASSVASFTSVLFLNPLSISELFLIPIRLWTLLMTLLGIRKRNKPWGTVYDSITKQPLDPAYVVLQDMQGNEVATSITDLDGRYGFLVEPGQYRLLANKTNYVFPSAKLAGRPSDELYSDLYFGEPITVVTSGEIIGKSIPLDPLKFDWNEFAKRDQSLMKFYSKRDLLLLKFSNAFFIFGLIVSLVAVLVAPKPYNIGIILLYAVLLVLKRTVLKPKPRGNIATKDGIPLAFAIIRVMRDSGFELIHKVTDIKGNFYCLLPNGNYTVTIEKKNLDQTYTKIMEGTPITVTKGYLDQKFII